MREELTTAALLILLVAGLCALGQRHVAQAEAEADHARAALAACEGVCREP